MAELKTVKQGLDMTTGSPYGLLLKFSIPLFVGNLFQQLYNTVDSIIVGRFVGTKALAAVGTGFPFMMAMLSIYIGIGIATTVMISQRFGAKNFAAASKVATTVYRVLFSVIPLAIIGFLASGPVLKVLNVPDDGTLSMATIYMQTIMVGSIGMIGFNINAGIMQGLGDSITPVRLLGLSTFLNIVLDIIFVVPMQLGVFGAALATIISQFISWVLGIRHINRTYDYINLKINDLPFEMDLFKEAMRLGLPMAIQNVLFSVGVMVLYSLVNSFGSAFMAGFTGANKIDAFVFMPLQSVANAMTAYTGQNVGARSMDRVRNGLHAGLVLTIVVSMVTAVILYPLADYAMRLFNTDPPVVATGVAYLHRVLPFFPLLATLFVYNSVLRGIGVVLVPMLSSVVGLWLARIPSAYWLANNFGKDNLFFAYAIGWVLGCIISITYFYYGSWERKVFDRFQAEDSKKVSGLST